MQAFSGKPPREKPQNAAADLFKNLTLSFLSFVFFFFLKKAGTPAKTTRIFCPLPNPEMPGKKGKTLTG